MKIAQIAPLYESVPPKFYGGTERVVSYLTETLVKKGHDVTLYASGDSITSAKLRPLCHRSLRLDRHSIDPIADHVLLLERLYHDASEFEIIHCHIDYLAFPMLRRMITPHLTTLHGRLDIPNLYNLYREFDDIPLVSISHNQRQPLPWVNWIDTIYHGLPEDLYSFKEGQGKYLAFIGRVSPEKRVEWAIEIAKSSGIPLKIAAKIEKCDTDYFEKKVKPSLDGKNIEFIGEISESEKNDFLGNAYALIFPIDWPEPFGLVMIEALACGTPVIARLRGSVAEIIESGVTGYVIKNISEAVKAVKQISGISRRRCRKTFEQQFTAKRMAENYLNAYEELIDKKNHPMYRMYG